VRSVSASAGQSTRESAAPDTRSDAELAELLADPALASLLLRLLVHDVTERARRDGVVATPKCQRLLRLLHAAAEKGLHSVDIPEVADDGHDHEPSEMISAVTPPGVTGLSVAQLAELSGRPCRTLRRWAAAGKVRAHRVGQVWLIDPESLKKGAP
jgi:excisionase family DNA binding protein